MKISAPAFPEWDNLDAVQAPSFPEKLPFSAFRAMMSICEKFQNRQVYLPIVINNSIEFCGPKLWGSQTQH